jgi:hypothetical protein
MSRAKTEVERPGGSPATTRADLDRAVWGVCDKLRASNCAGALQYVPELT